MFDEVSTGNGCCIFYYNEWIRLNASLTWVPLLMRVDPKGPMITAFDLTTQNGTTHDRTPIAYKMEASRDGYVWTQVHYETNSPAANAPNWYSSPSEAFVEGAVRPGKGFSVSNGTFAANEMLPNVSGVSVASNAVLEAQGDVELKTLSVDASGAGNGTVKGFAFASAGTLRVTGLGATVGRCEIPMAFEDCTGLANVSKWTLLFNGAPAPNYSAKATAEGIVLMANGTMLIMG